MFPAMKKLLLLFLILFSFQNAFSQIYDPVSFKTAVKELDSNTYELSITTQIEKNWHIYSQKVPVNGPMPTSFKFAKSKKYLEAPY